MYNKNESNYGVCFINCVKSDVNLLKYIYYSLYLATAVLTTDIKLEFSSSFYSTDSIESKKIIVWFVTYEQSIEFYSFFNKAFYKYLPYNIGNAQLTRYFNMLTLNDIVNLFSGECCGICFRNAMLFDREQIKLLQANNINSLQYGIYQTLLVAQFSTLHTLKFLF